MYYSAKRRASERGLVFTIGLKDIVVPEVCPVLGIALVPGTRSNYDNSPSLDRKDPARGYTPDNIRVISNRANRFKSDASLGELRAVIHYMEEQCRKE
jgi:hypothetical protein